MAYSYAAATVGMTTASSSTTSTGVIDSNHPYFLHNSDNPGTPLVSQLLTESNYHQWSRSVSIGLSAKLKLGLVDGTVSKPTDNPMHIAMWNRCNDMIVSWLLNSISTEIRNSVAYLATAKQIWDDLGMCFSQSNMPRTFQLRKELASIQQGNLSVTSYFTKFKTLVAELDNLAPIPKCICTNNNCTCHNMHKLEQYEECIKLSQFLMGLGDQFTAIQGQLLLMTPMPTLNQAFSLLLQEESQREFSAGSYTPVTENMAMHVKYNSAFKPKSASNNTQRKPLVDPSIVCDYCQNTGHTRDKCFCLHGYPEWHKLHGQPKPRPRKLFGNRNAAAAHVITAPSGHSGQANTDGKQSEMSHKDMPATSVFSETQCQQLARMIQESIKQSQNSLWNSNCNSQSLQLSGPYIEEGERDW